MQNVAGTKFYNVFFFLINFYLNVDCLEKLTLLTNTNTADIFTFLHLTI